jgi:4'-phosphopantetheinyl transferase
MQQRITRYRRWQDQHASLFGKLLLLKALQAEQYPADSLANLQYNAFGKPFLEGPLDFNLAHSGQFVLCAYSASTRVGVDVEEIRSINLEDFHSVFTAKEWQEIMQSATPVQTFFRYWAIKESVIKAEGKGLSLPLKDVLMEETQAKVYTNVWYLHQLPIHKDYSTWLATDKPNAQVQLTEVIF